jgi:flavodoxin I
LCVSELGCFSPFLIQNPVNTKNMNLQLRWLPLVVFAPGAFAWISAAKLSPHSSTRLASQVGIFYGTSTGSTQTAADLIHQAFGPELSSEPIDVDTIEDGKLAQAFAEHDALVVGTPTWNTGATTERSGTGWDELYYTKLPELRDILQGKKVAVFGLGDQISYSENYADASGELFDVFSEMSCSMLGSWSQEGYEHEDSKAIRGDKFCGLMLDFVNQEELSEDRVQRWVAQLKEEGIIDNVIGTATKMVAPQSVEASFTAHDVQHVNGHHQTATGSGLDSPLVEELASGSALLDATISAHSAAGFTAHTNPLTRKTMWTSADGRKFFVTTERTTRGLNP